MTLDEFVAQAGETPQDGAHYGVVLVDRARPQYRTSDEARTMLVQCQDSGASDMGDPDFRYWFYSCGSDIYKTLDDLERVICRVRIESAK